MSICTSAQCSCPSFLPSGLNSARCSRCHHPLEMHQTTALHSQGSCPFCSISASYTLDSQSTQRPSRLSSDRTSSPPRHLSNSGAAGFPHRIQSNSSFNIHISAVHLRPTELQSLKDPIQPAQPTKSTECESSSQRSFQPKVLESRPSNRRQASFSGPTTAFIHPNSPEIAALTDDADLLQKKRFLLEQIFTHPSQALLRRRSKSPYSVSVSQSRSQTPLLASKSPNRKLSKSRISRCSSRKSSQLQSPWPEEEKTSHLQRVYSEYFPGVSFNSAPNSHPATARVLEIEDDRLLLHFTGIGHTNSLNSVCFYDQNFLLTASSDYSIGKWRLPKGHLDPYKADSHIIRFGSQCKAERRWRAHTGKVWAVEALSRGRFCSTGDDGLVRIWSEEWKSECSEVIRLHIGPVQFASQFDINKLIVASAKTIQSCDVSTHQQVLTFAPSHSLAIRALTPTSPLAFATASDDLTAKLWDVRTGRCTTSLLGHTDSLNCVSGLGDFRLLTGSEDCTVRLWDLRTGREMDRLENGEKVKAVTGYSEELIFCGGDSLVVWERGICRKLQTTIGSIRCVRSLASARLLVTAGAGNSFLVWRVLF